MRSRVQIELETLVFFVHVKLNGVHTACLVPPSALLMDFLMDVRDITFYFDYYI